MRRSLRYLDAVKVLAGGENQLVKLLDEASATMLLGVGVFDLFEARAQALRLLEKVLDKFGEKLRGIDRLTRTERIHAAHEIIRITAYFDALGDAMGEWPVRFSATEQVELASQTSSGRTWPEIYEVLGETELLPQVFSGSSSKPFKMLSLQIEARLRAYAVWDSLNDTEREHLVVLLRDRVPEDAAVRYQESLRRLSADCPEFGVWVNLQAHAATRDQIATGLADLETLLAPLAAESAEHQQESLSRAYRAALAKPIIVTSGSDSHLALPSLGEGYVDHSFRIETGVLPASKDWHQYDLRGDLPNALGAYLMSPEALRTPLLILGQPGSGKSVLTRVLAARLPAERFLPIRVELRRVNAEADLQDYIESAIREQTGEQVRWTSFVTATPDLTPVVILDGFDELLQATGVAQTDFLLRIERFQDRELDQGRSVAVIVTSRTAVANRATLPAGISIIRLEPFSDKQIAAWVGIWNRANGASLTERGVRQLSADVVLRYRELAEQPLLLLMLALYDATDNALASVDTDVSPGAIYERLLKDFARRELTKDPDVTDLERRVEQELLRLSIVAFAMFNRGAQWIDVDSLTDDLRALDIWEAPRNQHTFRSTLSAGQQMVGRFFFIHDVQATRDGGELQTYEFLHATFSEYLIARLVVRLLTELAAQHLASAYSVSRSINDAMLYALLSFECLAVRTPIIAFTGDLLTVQDPKIRSAVNEVIVTLFHDSLMERSDRTYSDYQPAVLELVDRAGRWNANLFLLMAMDPDGVSMRALYPERGNGAIYEWHRLTNLWRSCVRGEGWNGLADCLGVERAWAGEDDRDIIAGVWFRGAAGTGPDMTWSYHIPGAPWNNGDRWDSHSHRGLMRHADFLLDRRMDVAMHNTEPIGQALPDLGNVLHRTADGRLVTMTYLLTAALVAPYSSEPADEAIIELAGSLSHLRYYEHESALYEKLVLSLVVTAVELASLSHGTLETLRKTLLRGVILAKDPKLVHLHARLRELLGEDVFPTAPIPPMPATSAPPAPSPATSSPETPATPPAAP